MVWVAALGKTINDMSSIFSLDTSSEKTPASRITKQLQRAPLQLQFALAALFQ